MELALRFCGYIGAVLLGFGVLGGYIVGFQAFLTQPLLVLHIVLGVLCLVAWILTSGWASVGRATSAMSGRTARYGAHAVMYSIVAAGLLIVANVFVALNEKRWDLTEKGVYSLSPKSEKVIAGLTKPVRMVAIKGQQGVDDRSVLDLMNLYRMANEQQVKTELIDPRVRPGEVDRLGMKPGNLLYIEYGEGDNKAVSRLNQIDEQSVTNGILKLTRGAAKKVYYLQGHGEPQLQSAGQGGMKEFADTLADEHITVEGLILASSGSVPNDAAGLIVAAPTKPIPLAERDAIIKFANGGGRLLLFANPEDRDSEDIRALAGTYGIEVGNDVVLDQQLRLFAGPQVAVQFIAQQFGAHPITTGLSAAEPLVFTFAASVRAQPGAPSDTKVVELVKSGKSSWAERNMTALFDPQGASAARDADDLGGPVSIAVALEKPAIGESSRLEPDSSFKPTTRVVVFGDATWVQNGNLATMGNRDVALNSINWAIGEEGGVAIGPKTIRASIAPIPQATFNLILALSFIGPELIFLLGLFIWWRRRVGFSAAPTTGIESGSVATAVES
ncbi:MAG: GldG family protein [Pseudomonadota bacterium]